MSRGPEAALATSCTAKQSEREEMDPKKVVANSLVFLHRFLRRRLTTVFSRRTAHAAAAAAAHVKLQPHPLPPSPFNSLLTSAISAHGTVVLDVEGSLLRSASTFPYFLLVALEAGGFLRGLLLLLLYPLVWLVGEDVGGKVMAFVSFCGTRKDTFRAGRAVLPKHLIDGMGLEGLEIILRIMSGAAAEGKRRPKVVGVSSMPSVMVEAFLKDYLAVDVVLGREMKVVYGYYTGIMEDNKGDDGIQELLLRELFEDDHGGTECHAGALGIAGSSGWKKLHPPHTFFAKCKEVFVVTEAQKRSWHAVPHGKQLLLPNPLVFHDGRLAFRPTPLAILTMFLWLPFGFILALTRAIVFLTVPYSLSTPALALLGMKSRLIIGSGSSSPPTTAGSAGRRNNLLYACNHRTLLDPLYISAALRTSVTAMTYSLSKVSEVLSPIKTVRLTRNREEDRRRMEHQLREANLVVCPEGTTCREPFLMRFSPLFTELTDEVVPVALESKATMFYGTTAGGHKCLDPLFFLMNPSPCYSVEFLEKVKVVGGGGDQCGSCEMANMVQSAIGRALGYQCTSLTRRDKYLMLAGNEGFVNDNSQ